MNKLTGLVLIICAVIFILLSSTFKDTVHHTMRIIDGKVAVGGDDGRNYYVLADKPEHKQAAKLISNVNEFMVELIQRLKKKYLYSEKTCLMESSFEPEDEFVPFAPQCSNPLKDFRYRAVYLLVTRYRPNRLEENQPTSKDDTSWEEGKGERIALCLREQQTGKFDFIDPDLVKFVAIHELTHIAANTLEHPDYFWKVFKFLLVEANLLLGYQLTNYKQNPKNYCGMTVTSNPTFDEKIQLVDEPTDIVSLN